MTTHIISGEWLLTDPGSPDATYTEAYAGEIVDRWSGGVVFLVTREVADRIVTRQIAVNAEFGDDSEALSWDGDTLVMHSDQDDYTLRVEPEDGRYRIGWWTWSPVEQASVSGPIYGLADVSAFLPGDVIEATPCGVTAQGEPITRRVAYTLDRTPTEHNFGRPGAVRIFHRVWVPALDRHDAHPAVVDEASITLIDRQPPVTAIIGTAAICTACQQTLTLHTDGSWWHHTPRAARCPGA